MSMCMYLRAVTELDAKRFEQDPDQLMKATIGGTMALWADRFGDIPGSKPLDPEELLNVEFELDAVKPKGFLNRVVWWLTKRSLKADLANQKKRLSKVLKSVKEDHQTGADGETVLDLHKSWHLLHYLLTGSSDGGPHPQNMLLLGGREVGEDLGYGPARIVTPEEATAFARALEALDPETLLERLDPDELRELELYSTGFEDEGDEIEMEEDVRHYFPMLKSYMAEAAAKRRGVLIWMS